MKNKLIPKHQTPNQPLVLSQDNTKVESPYIKSIPITETSLYKQYLADPYKNSDFNTWKKRQELIQSSRKDEKVKADNRSSKVKAQETKQGEAIHSQQERKKREAEANKVIWTGIGLGGLALAQATPAAPYIDAAFAANGALGLAKQADEGTLGLNLETGLNTLQMLPFGIRGIKYVDDVAREAYAPYDFYRTIQETTPVVKQPIQTEILVNPIKHTQKGSMVLQQNPPAKISAAERAGVPKGDRNLKVKPETNWDPEDWFSYRLNQQWTPEDAQILASHVPEYREIERIARANKTFMKFPDGTPFKGDPREWIMMMSQNGKNVYNPLRNSEIIPSGVYRSGVRDMQNAEQVHRVRNAFTGVNDEFVYDPISNQIDVWNGTNRKITTAFGQNFDLSYNPIANISDPVILKRVQQADNIREEAAQYLSKLLDQKVDPHYLDNYNLSMYKGDAKQLGLTEKQLSDAIKQLDKYTIQYNNTLHPPTDVTYTSLYPIRSTRGKVYSSPDGKQRNWSEILLDDGTIGVTDDAVREARNQGYDFTVIKNVREGGMEKIRLNKDRNHDIIIHSGTPRVSFLGNNGDLTGIGGVYKKQGGQLIPKHQNSSKPLTEKNVRPVPSIVTKPRDKKKNVGIPKMIGI